MSTLVIPCLRGTVTIAPCEYGLKVHFRGNLVRRSCESWIVPGEYPLSDVATFIAAQTPDVARVVISDALLESELWYARGFLDDPATWPRELFTKVSLFEFARATPKNYRTWMKAVVYDHPIFKHVSAERIDRLIETGEYPEKLHSIRYWKQFSLESLQHIVRYGIWRHPDYGLFASQHYGFYEAVIEGHSEVWKEFSEFVRACKTFPKTAKTRELFADVYRLGGSLRGARRLKRVRDLANYRDALARYKPPKAPLPKGWLWANAATFPKLGDLYNCCISGAGSYGHALGEGSGAIAYRPAFDCRNDLGALAYFVRIGRGEWRLGQIEGWSNTRIEPRYEQAAQGFVRLLRG